MCSLQISARGPVGLWGRGGGEGCILLTCFHRLLPQIKGHTRPRVNQISVYTLAASRSVVHVGSSEPGRGMGGVRGEVCGLRSCARE